MECPLSIEQQRGVLQEITPVGTSRTEAEQRLKLAGVEFTKGRSSSIYYCHLWTRPGGERWHMNVAILFDRLGNVYATRAADAPIGLALNDPGDLSAEPGSGRWRAASSAAAAAESFDDQSGAGSERVPFIGKPN